MFKVVKTKEVYDFSELSEEAKEKAKEWYLNDPFRGSMLTDDMNCDLSNIFPESDLKVQWSLCNCQGDGVNIYGKLDLNDIFSLPGSGRAPELDWISGYLTDKEIRTMRFYMDQYKAEVELPENRRYSYCIANQIDIAEDFQYELVKMEIRDIRMAVLEKVEKLVRQVISQLCISFEKAGYEYLYEISDEDMKDECSEHAWFFLEDGSWFNGDMDEPNELKEYRIDNDLGGWTRIIKNEGGAVDSLSFYRITFLYSGICYSCYVYATSLDEAMFLFFKNNPHITFSMLESYTQIGRN